MVGRITSVWVQPAKPIGQSNDMPVNGCVSGCASSTKWHGRGLGGFLPKAYTPPSGLSGLLSGSAAFRERSRDVSSGSRMRENCMSGCVSSEGWHVQQEINLPGQESEAP